MCAVTEILKSISTALNMEFGDGYKNYIEEVKQGLNEPCFFISCINPTHNLFLGIMSGNRRYFRENQFCIQYFPANHHRENEECHETAGRLEFCLEWITVGGDPIRGSNMKYEIADGILNFFVNYDMFVFCENNAAPMEEISENIYTKG